MSNKDIAEQIFNKHLHLAAADGRLFRKTVMDETMAATGCSLAAASTYYNTCKKSIAPIEGLGRAPVNPNIKKIDRSKPIEDLIDDSECYTVLEIKKIINDSVSCTVGRTHSFEGLGLARIKLNKCKEAWPNVTWKLISGLGPNPGDEYILRNGEKEIA